MNPKSNCQIFALAAAASKATLVAALAAPLFGQIDNVAPWRVQLRVHTCDQSEAGTDSKVFVRFTSNPMDRFWLAHGGNDRKRNNSNTYDVVIRDPIPGAATNLGHITEITLGINGSDKWCFDKVELFVNNPNPGIIGGTTALAHRIFDSGFISGGIWVSTGDRGDFRVMGPEVTVASNSASMPPLFRTLRGGLWNVLLARVAILNCPRADGLVGVDRLVLEEYFESYLGHMMGPGEAMSDYRYGALVGRAWVEIKRRTANSIRVDVDIIRERSPDVFSRMFDKEFALEFVCTSGGLSINVLEVDVDGHFLVRLFTLGISEGVNRLIEALAGGGLAPTVIPTPICLPPQFNADGDLTFTGTASLTRCYAL